MSPNHLSQQVTPADAAAEKLVLTALLKSPTAVPVLLAQVRASHFDTLGYQQAVKVIAALSADGVAVTTQSVSERLADAPDALRAVADAEVNGGSGRALTKAVGAAGVVARMHARREALKAGYTLAQTAATAADINVVVAEAIGHLAGLRSDVGASKAPLSPEATRERVAASLRERMAGNGNHIVRTGLAPLDDITGGFAPGNLIILAARPGMGKSAICLCIARAVSRAHGDVSIYSQEMDTESLYERLIAADTGIDSRDLRNPAGLSEADKAKVFASLDDARDRIHVADAGVSIADLESHVTAQAEAGKLVMVIIDYLQIMTSTRRKGDNQTQEISERTLRLKALAKRANVVMLALSQLSRAVEQRGGDHRPMLSDLRDSGSIEQDADMVIFLHRPEYYDVTRDAEGNSLKGLCNAIVAKNRHGAQGDAKLRYWPATNRFEAWTDLDSSGGAKLEPQRNVNDNPWAPIAAAKLQSAAVTTEEEIPF